MIKGRMTADSQMCAEGYTLLKVGFLKKWEINYV